MDETYRRAKGQWLYFYHTADSKWNTIEIYLSKTRNYKDTR
ncbi:DDE-type integrase/transposase/recombinase [Bacillus cereus]|nr:DDE-type integrase/transposase/recombinase [Bacillus cereus]HDR6957501.1 DDE-type integrase/transposase/recombinase [Bacillus cereus]